MTAVHREGCCSEFYLGPGVARTSPIAEQSLVAKLMKCSDGANLGEMPERDKTHRGTEGSSVFGAELRVLPPGLLPIHDPARGEASEDRRLCVAVPSDGRWQSPGHSGRHSHSLSWSHATISAVLAGCSDQLWLMMEGPPGVSGGRGEQREEGHWGQ